MMRLAAWCCALALACAARAPGAPTRAGPDHAAAGRGPACGATAPPADRWQRGHEPPPIFAFDRARSPPPSPRLAAGALPPLPFTRWPAEMVSWSSLDSHASIYAQRWPRERSPEAFLLAHLQRLTENLFIDVHVDPASVTRGEVERAGRRFTAEEFVFSSTGHTWRNLLWATASPGGGVCVFGVTAADLAPGSEPMTQLVRLVDGVPR